MSVDHNRRLAAEGLLKVENSSYSNLVFSSMARDPHMSDADKAFTAKLFYGTLERKLTLDYILQSYISKPLNKLDREVLAILRSGLYQILYMNSVPDFAAVNQAVGLCSYFRKTSAKGLVNAVLRKAAKFDIKTAVFKSEEERLSVMYSVSRPAVRILMRDYPGSCERILAGMFAPPRLTIVVNRTKISVPEYINLLEQAGIAYEYTPVKDCLRVKHRGAVTGLPGFEQGYFFVQGLASRYAVECAGIQPGDRVLDLCAAPGGKSFAAALSAGGNCHVTSCDPNLSRLQLIKQGAQRLGISCIDTMQNRGEVYNSRLEGQDRVICDVPCSGLGIIAKKPDLRCKRLDELDRLCELQRQILSSGASYLKKGGRLVYSTCTLNKDENERQIEKFLSANKNFRLARQDCRIDGAENNDNMVTFLPSKANCDGFFVAVLEKMW